MEFEPKTVFGYEIQFQIHGQSLRATLPDFPNLGRLPPSPSRGRIIRDAYDAVLAELDRIRAAGDDPPKGYHSGHPIWQTSRDTIHLNRQLVWLGYYTSPLECTGPDLAHLTDICQGVDPAAPIADLGEDNLFSLEVRIHDVLDTHILSAANRAKFIRSLWMETPILSDYAHLVEDAFVNLYRGSLISAANTLLPLFEGVLARWYAVEHPGTGHPDRKQLLNFLAERQHAKAPTMVHPVFTDEHLWALGSVLETYIWGDMGQAKNLGYFNRHYAMHLGGPGRFYRPSNVMRLVLMSDLLAQVVAACQGTHGSFVYPSAKYEDRRKYYMLESRRSEAIWPFYQAFMTQHPRYDPPDEEE